MAISDISVKDPELCPIHHMEVPHSILAELMMYSLYLLQLA